MNLREKYENMKDIPDQELYETLQNNEVETCEELAWVCSEVLRRLIEREHKPAEYDD